MIYSGPSAGQVVVAGANQTTVNDQLSAQTFSGVNKITLKMKGGSDRVLFTNLNIAGRVECYMHDGNDVVTVRGTTPAADFAQINEGSIPYGPVTAGDLSYVVGGNGNDSYRIFNATILDDATMIGGPGDDFFLIDGQLSKNHIGRPGGPAGESGISCEMQQGNDVVRIQRTHVYGGAVIHDFGTNDTGTSSTIEFFNVKVTDHVTIRNGSYASKIVSFDGENHLAKRFEAAHVFCDGTNVNVQRADVGDLHINLVSGSGSTGPSGPQNIAVRDSVFTYLQVSLRDGDDVLTLGNVTSDTTSLNGGWGDDTLVDEGGNSLGDATILNFD